MDILSVPILNVSGFRTSSICMKTVNRSTFFLFQCKTAWSGFCWELMLFMSLFLHGEIFTVGIQIQWLSEYQTSLEFEWWKVVPLPNGPLLECHLNTGLNLVQYSDHHLNTGQVIVCYSDVSVIQIFVIQISAVLRTSDYQNFLKRDFYSILVFKW